MREGRAAQLGTGPLDDPAWDAKLAAHPDSTFFHGSAWARVLAKTYGYKPCYFTEDCAQGSGTVIPLMEVNSILTGRRGISLPFTDECEPLSQDQASFRKCYDRILSHAREHNWRYVEMRGGKRFMENALTSTQFYGHELDLGFDEETLFKNIEPSVRRAIRKAEQSVLTVECSQGEEAVKSFYRLLCKTRKRLGVPPQPYSFFREIQKEVISNGLGWVMLARNGSRPVAGAVFFVNGQKATYKFGASDDKFQHLRANNLVMWSAIRKLRAEGARSLDFGRTTLSNEGLRKFKLGWGTTERTIDYVRYDLRTSSNVTKTDASSGWHSAIFKALPTPLSRLIGVALYKHIA